MAGRHPNSPTSPAFGGHVVCSHAFSFISNAAGTVSYLQGKTLRIIRSGVRSLNLGLYSCHWRMRRCFFSDSPNFGLHFRYRWSQRLCKCGDRAPAWSPHGDGCAAGNGGHCRPATLWPHISLIPFLPSLTPDLRQGYLLPRGAVWGGVSRRLRMSESRCEGSEAETAEGAGESGRLVKPWRGGG